MATSNKSGYMQGAITILIFVLILLLNNLWLINKIEAGRSERTRELEEKMRNMQSRINLNVSRIENIGE